MDKQTEKVVINIKTKQGLNVNLQKNADMNVSLNGSQDIKINNPTIGQVTTDYERLKNKPKINTVELIGNKTSRQLGLQDQMDSLTNIELDNLIQF